MRLSAGRCTVSHWGRILCCSCLAKAIISVKMVTTNWNTGQSVLLQFRFGLHIELYTSPVITLSRALLVFSLFSKPPIGLRWSPIPFAQDSFYAHYLCPYKLDFVICSQIERVHLEWALSPINSHSTSHSTELYSQLHLRFVADYIYMWTFVIL